MKRWQKIILEIVITTSSRVVNCSSFQWSRYFQKSVKWFDEEICLAFISIWMLVKNPKSSMVPFIKNEQLLKKLQPKIPISWFLVMLPSFAIVDRVAKLNCKGLGAKSKFSSFWFLIKCFDIISLVKVWSVFRREMKTALILFLHSRKKETHPYWISTMKLGSLWKGITYLRDHSYIT